MPEGTKDLNAVKRRRLQGACDLCRRKKVRCDSAEMPGNRCTNCIAFQAECTHLRPKGPDPKLPVVTPPTIDIPRDDIPLEDTRTAQEHVAAVLSTSTVYIPSNDPYAIQQAFIKVSKYARSLEEEVAALRTQIPGSHPSSQKSDAPPRATEGPPPLSTDNLRHFHTASNTSDVNFNAEVYSKESSSMQFVKTAIQHVEGNNSYVIGTQRLQFWTIQPWEKVVTETTPLSFPEDDLMKNLIKIYFDQINPILCILHFPSFRDSVAKGLHFRDRNFGSVVLAVCALASRYSDDPRVFLDGENSEHSCGWKWFRQIEPFKALASPEPGLYRLQWISLSVLYLAGSSNPSCSWVLVATGIRLAQRTGVHGRNHYSRMEPVEAELYKRVFWVLMTTDTIISSLKGRPTLTHDEDFDIELPLACDEEYWDKLHPIQPPGVPSSNAFLPIYMQLMMIYGRIQHSVYPVNGQICGPEVIAELDSALNSWVDDIPSHLRWDPHQENQVFLDQSAALYAFYYHTQILLHRPFIPAPGKVTISSANFPALAICANAARSCGHVMDLQSRRGRGLLHHPHVMTALFDSAVVLLINVWGGRTKDLDRAKIDVENCVRVLRLYERRWRVAGRKCDIISAMLNLGKYTSTGPSLKRRRHTEDSPSSSPNNVTDRQQVEYPSAGPSTPMVPQNQEPQLSTQQKDNLFSLPLYTNELGQLSAYESFGYNFGFQPPHAQYQPQSHLPSETTPMLEFASVPSVYSQQTGIGFSDGSDMARSFDIPMGYNSDWEEWCIYLTSVDEFNQGPSPTPGDGY